MPGVNLENITYGLKDCEGYSKDFASQHIQKYVPVNFAALTTRFGQEFTSPMLKDALFREVQHYVDRGLYHLVVGKRLISESQPTWGLVSMYYSSFFAAQAAIRLKGRAFIKIDYTDQEAGIPTYLLEVKNFVTNLFTVRKAAERNEHRRVWNAFYDLYSGFSRIGFARFAPITEDLGTEVRFAELNRRNFLNYVPGYGYLEITSPKELTKSVRVLSGDLFERLQDSLADPDCELEVKAYLRVSLCLSLLDEIANQHGKYAKFHIHKNAQRRAWLETFACPAKLSARINQLLL